MKVEIVILCDMVNSAPFSKNVTPKIVTRLQTNLCKKIFEMLLSKKFSPVYISVFPYWNSVMWFASINVTLSHIKHSFSNTATIHVLIS